MFLLGDYNMNFLKCDFTEMADFFNALYSVKFFPLITKPSRITSSSAALTDNILFNYCEFEVTSGLLIWDASDHLPVFQFKFNNPKNDPNKSIL